MPISSSPPQRDWNVIRAAERRLSRAGFVDVSTVPLGETNTAIDFHIDRPVWATRRQQGSSLILNADGFDMFTLRFPLIDTTTTSAAELEHIANTAVDTAGLPDMPIIEPVPHEGNRIALHISYEQGANETLRVTDALDYIVTIRDNVVSALTNT